MAQQAAQPATDKLAFIPAIVPRYRILELASELLKILGGIAIGLGLIWLMFVLLQRGSRETVLPPISLVCSGVWGLILGQCLECLRDMTRNSFYIRRRLNSMGSDVQ